MPKLTLPFFAGAFFAGAFLGAAAFLAGVFSSFAAGDLAAPFFPLAGLSSSSPSDALQPSSRGFAVSGMSSSSTWPFSNAVRNWGQLRRDAISLTYLVLVLFADAVSGRET